MARVELPASRVRSRRRKRFVIFISIVFGCLLLIFAGLVWLSHASFLRITTITVSGEQTISEASVQAVVQNQLAGSYGYLFARDNIFLYPKGRIEAALPAAMTVIASVEVHAVNFHTIAVSIVERQPKALWCGESTDASSSSCLLLDQNGVAYDPADPLAQTSTYKRYFGVLSASSTPAQYLTPSSFSSLSALVDTLAQSQPQDSIASVFVDPNNDVHVTFGSGFTLLFALSADGGDVYSPFMLALQSDPFTGHTIGDFEYLDLRFGDRLYYKLKGQ
jgi:hypothetical protein